MQRQGAPPYKTLTSQQDPVLPCTGGTNPSPQQPVREPACQRNIFTQMVHIHPGSCMAAVNMADYE